MDRRGALHRLTRSLPFLGLLLLVVTWGADLPPVGAGALALVHVAIVGAAVVRAETIARRVGEPFGTLVLAVAVTVIEVGLIVALMVSEAADASSLARDTVFAAVMIVCNGVVGVSLLLAARGSHDIRFSEQGANALLGTIVTLATLSLVMPTFTSSTSGPTFSGSQLAFAAVTSAVVYGIFVAVQTRGLRWMFQSGTSEGDGRTEEPATPVWLLGQIVLLLVSLVVVVGLAKTLAPSIEEAVVWAGAPQSFVGVVIAVMVLLPESVAAFRAASRGEVQTSLNLALGSALASIGLTIPAIAVASIWLDGPIVLGLGAKEIVFLVLTSAVSALTFGSGRATVLQATHHLVIFVAFVFLAIVP